VQLQLQLVVTALQSWALPHLPWNMQRSLSLSTKLTALLENISTVQKLKQRQRQGLWLLPEYMLPLLRRRKLLLPSSSHALLLNLPKLPPLRD
jgi:hypothetical protein